MIEVVRVICPHCNGSGRWCKTQATYPDGTVLIETKPMSCKGKGYILAQIWQGPPKKPSTTSKTAYKIQGLKTNEEQENNG
jgi:DnaJ-class molecular chaperone